MAEAEDDVNLETLSDAQRDLLHQFREFTAINSIDVCISKLEAHGWNLESAIHDTFGISEQPEPSAMSVSDNGIERASSYENLSSNQRLVDPSSGSIDVQRRLGWLEWLKGWILFPYRFTFGIVADIFNFVGRFFWSIFGRGRGDPVEDVMSFKKNFEEKYGKRHPTFYQGSYSQVLSDAKKELRFLLVYLHSDDHQDTPSFCSSVLCNEGFTEYVNGNMLFWGCDVNSYEGYRVSRAMRELNYPFLGVVCLRDNRMTVVWRMEGLIDLDELISTLARCIDANEAALVAARAERAERSHTQVLRQEQDAAYLESLRADQEKARKRKEEEDERRRLEQEKHMKVVEKERKVEEIAKRRQECQSKVDACLEPDADDPTAISIRIKLPNGTLLSRRFQSTDTLQFLYDFTFAHKDSPPSFLLSSIFPRKTFNLEPDADSTLNQVGLTSGCSLFVQNTADDSSDEESS